MLLKEIKQKIKFTQTPEPNFAYQRVVSFSQYSMWIKCPYSWYMQKIKKVVPEIPNIYQIFGTAIHYTLQHYFKIVYDTSGAAADREDIINLFEIKFSEEYKLNYEKYGQHFSSPEEMGEFYQDGVQILEWLKKHRGEFFTTRKVDLLGIELPLLIEIQKNIFLKGFLDIILFDSDLNKVKIIDFKTSTRGWYDKDKKDEAKYPQLILYKEYLAKQYDLSLDDIDIEYIILKRKIWEKSEFPQKRIQSFVPSHGKNSRNKFNKSFQEFLDDCFDSEGKVIEKEFEAKASEKNCKWCPVSKEQCPSRIE